MNDALRDFLRDPPPRSATRAALDFGIDLTLTVGNAFVLTPAERLERMQLDQTGPSPTVIARAEPEA